RLRVDVQHLGLGEPGLSRRGVDAVDRTGDDTRGVAAARLRDDVRHRSGNLARAALAVGGPPGAAPHRLAAETGARTVDLQRLPDPARDRVHQVELLGQGAHVVEDVTEHDAGLV